LRMPSPNPGHRHHSPPGLIYAATPPSVALRAPHRPFSPTPTPSFSPELDISRPLSQQSIRPRRTDTQSFFSSALSSRCRLTLETSSACTYLIRPQAFRCHNVGQCCVFEYNTRGLCRRFLNSPFCVHSNILRKTYSNLRMSL
jgi:hypothetical protein